MVGKRKFNTDQLILFESIALYKTSFYLPILDFVCVFVVNIMIIITSYFRYINIVMYTFLWISYAIPEL